MAVEPHEEAEGERDGAGGVDPEGDADVWRCKDCGAVQRTHDPPCERCWGTTFVSGEGAGHAASGAAASPAEDPASGASLTATRVDHVQSASARTALVAGGFAVLVAGANSVVQSSLLSWLLAGAAVLLGGFAVLALAVTLLALLVDVFGLTAGP
jgi:hypothetical protein